MFNSALIIFDESQKIAHFLVAGCWAARSASAWFRL